MAHNNGFAISSPTSGSCERCRRSQRSHRRSTFTSTHRRKTQPLNGKERRRLITVANRSQSRFYPRSRRDSFLVAAVEIAVTPRSSLSRRQDLQRKPYCSVASGRCLATNYLAGISRPPSFVIVVLCRW